MFRNSIVLTPICRSTRSMKVVAALCRVTIPVQSLALVGRHFSTRVTQFRARRSTITGLSTRDGRGLRHSGNFWSHDGRRVATLTSPISTIYALSTAAGRAAIAVIRISGPASLEIYYSLCPGKAAPEPRRAIVRTLFEPGSASSQDDVLDSSALILYFQAPKTATGEDVLELHVHGGPAIVKSVLSAISKCSSPGTGEIRYAEPGEFTRRAFLNDRLDLTQVEALGDALTATTEQQRRLSVRGAFSKLSKSYETWRQDLLYARGELEALIDFSEDQHFDESPSELCSSVASRVHSLHAKLTVHSQNAVRGEMLRHGITIALIGAPNAGKSSLLNRIVGREAAIVSDEAGTTRDVVEVGLNIGGYLCRIGDTAGLRKFKHQLSPQGPDESVQQQISKIEAEGMRRAKQRAAESDVVIVVLGLEVSASAGNQVVQLRLDPEVVATIRHLVHENDNVMVVVNKVDLLATELDPHHPGLLSAERGVHASVLTGGLVHVETMAGFTEQIINHLPGLHPSQIHMVSCKDPTPGPSVGTANLTSQGPVEKGGAGIETFMQGLVAQFQRMTAALSPEPMSRDSGMLPNKDHGLLDPDPAIWQESLGASERHRILLDECCDALAQFLLEVEPAQLDGSSVGDTEADIVVAAEHLRAAAECLAKITGRGGGGDVEEVLGVVFENFCVGK